MALDEKEDMILDENKKYNQDETIELLESVREFFQDELKLVVHEWMSDQNFDNINNLNDGKSAIDIFYIEKLNEPLYAKCNGYNDVEIILKSFEEDLQILINNLDELLDNNKNLDKNTIENIESYADVVDKCISVYINQKNRRKKKFKERTTIEELREELRNFFAEIIRKFLIEVLMYPLYERIKKNSGVIYELVVKNINTFLQKNGIYTKNILAGEKINLDITEPTIDSSDNITDNFNMVNIIEEVRKYPYFFADGTKVVDGSAKIWRGR
ncbi:hypothetical protein [Intestinibacter sp.]